MIARPVAVLASLNALAVSHVAVAAPREPLRLAPSSPWRVHYDDDSCRMARTFGQGDTETFLIMDRYGPGDGFTLTVIGKPLASEALRGGRPVETKIRFGEAESEQIITAAPVGMGVQPGFVSASVSFADIPSDETAKVWRPQITAMREAAVNFIDITAPSNRRVVLETGSMGKPMDAMRACTDELLTHWGIDVARHARRTEDAMPASDPGRWIKSSDYPRDLVAQGRQAIVHFRMTIGTDGKPSACHIQRTTRSPKFDDAVCKAMMQRAKFTPARDEQGEPMVSYFRSSVRFQVE